MTQCTLLRTSLLARDLGQCVGAKDYLTIGKFREKQLLESKRTSLAVSPKLKVTKTNPLQLIIEELGGAKMLNSLVAHALLRRIDFSMNGDFPIFKPRVIGIYNQNWNGSIFLSFKLSGELHIKLEPNIGSSKVLSSRAFIKVCPGCVGYWSN